MSADRFTTLREPHPQDDSPSVDVQAPAGCSMIMSDSIIPTSELNRSFPLKVEHDEEVWFLEACKAPSALPSYAETTPRPCSPEGQSKGPGPGHPGPRTSPEIR
jgi:hypothetical protein